MMIAGAKCDKCGVLETMKYISDAALEVMLRQNGWVIKDGKTICRICDIEERKK